MAGTRRPRARKLIPLDLTRLPYKFHLPRVGPTKLSCPTSFVASTQARDLHASSQTHRSQIRFQK